MNTDDILLEILKSNVFFKTEKVIDYSEEKTKKYEVRTHHSFTDKIRFEDFEKLNFEDFEIRIKAIEQEPDWGIDLPIFRKLITNSKEWIIGNNYQKEQFYFIYAGSISKEKLIESNFYSYFMSIVIMSNSDSKVIIINHGGD